MIYCVGNSHVLAFRDYAGFKAYHLWAATAYNFVKNGYFQEAMRVVDENAKEDDYATFVVGEIDCRWHIPKQADAQRRRDFDITSECVDRFFPCFEILKQKHKTFILGALPTSTLGHTDGNGCLIYGGMERRNSICKMWNQALKDRASVAGIPFVSIYDHLVHADGSTNAAYFCDYCHLNGAMVEPLWREELKKAGIDV